MIDAPFPPYAYDDDLIAAAKQGGHVGVRVYRLKAAVVVLGAGSRPESELHLDACRVDKIPILKRYGGGCAVLLDPGNVIVSLAARGLPFGRHRHFFDLLTAWLIDGLERIGISGITQAGICDLALHDRKVGGACLHRSRDLLYYSASLLVKPDLAGVTRYIKHPPREPDYRHGRCHADFMGALTGFDPASLAAELRRTVQAPNLAGARPSQPVPTQAAMT